MRKPADIDYQDVLLRWAVAVGEGFVWFARSSPIGLRECWIGKDLALLATYDSPARAGVRFGSLHVDPTSGQPLDPSQRGTSSHSSLAQASNLFHGAAVDGGLPEEAEWTSPDGRLWWGDAPSGESWARAVEGERLALLYRG